MPNVWGNVGGLQFALPMETLLGLPYQLLGMNAAGDKLQYKNAFYNNASAQFYVPAGAVGAPSYSFDTDLDTGFYRIGADNVGLALGGVNAIDWSAVRAKLSTVLQMNGKIIEEDQSIDIVAAATTDLSAATGNSVTITNAAGATVISSLGAANIPSGTEIETRFSITGGSVSLQYDPVILDVLGQQNVNLVDGDIIRWRKTNDAAANWRMVAFARRNFPPVPLTFTAAGDLLVGTGQTTANRHSVGTAADGKVLTKDDSQTDKMEWYYPPQGAKNAVINGDMQVWQKNGLDDTVTFTTGNTATADCWLMRPGAGFGTFTISRSSDVPSFGSAGRDIVYSLKTVINSVAAENANNCWAITHPIENTRWAYMIGQSQCTLSFWVKSNKPGTYCVVLTGKGGFQQAGATDYINIAEYQINNADTWEFKTIHFSADAHYYTIKDTPRSGRYIYFVLAAGSAIKAGVPGVWTNNWTSFVTANQVNLFDTINNYINITGVQIEKGPIATEFEIKAFPNTLDDCLRYYEKSFDYDIPPKQNAGLGTGEYRFPQVVGVSTSMEMGSVAFVKKKANSDALAMTITLYNPAAANAQARNITGGTDYSATAVQSRTENGFNARGTTNAAGAAGNSGGFHWTADCYNAGTMVEHI